eukprot:TRINITY_DN2325_c1_g1_i1.p1 TRINITY_DN2325_c1_g1~~TRINITY_DN2325_c1_g1_i1.p1  ORF type:complete len:128 (-),score=11.32 TRINITY_DN2325_c1_g1_i1:443-826(-)
MTSESSFWAGLGLLSVVMRAWIPPVADSAALDMAFIDEEVVIGNTKAALSGLEVLLELHMQVGLEVPDGGIVLLDLVLKVTALEEGTNLGEELPLRPVPEVKAGAGGWPGCCGQTQSTGGTLQGPEG